MGKNFARILLRSTLLIGEELIAHCTNVTVVGGFRQVHGSALTVVTTGGSTMY